MDNIDDFFDEKAIDAFCQDIHFDIQAKALEDHLKQGGLDTETGESKAEYREALLSHEELLLSSIFPQAIPVSKIKKEEACQALLECGLGGQFYPNEKGVVMDAIEKKGKSELEAVEVADIGRELIRAHPMEPKKQT